MNNDRNCTPFVQTESTRRNCILDTLKKIDQQQKESVIDSDCIGCVGSLITKQFDTKPVIITLAGGLRLNANIGPSTTTSDLFRVEDVRNECCLLRVLERNGGMIRCTQYTCICKVDCICALQCLDPINCDINRSERCTFLE